MNQLNYEELEDLELLAKISEKDRQALAELYDRYGRRVFALAVRMLNDPVGSEEVTQDVFMSVWRRGASYTSKKGKFTTWLFSIAHNRTIDELRKRKRDRSRENTDIDDHLNIQSSDISPADAAVAQSEYLQIRAAMEKLPVEQKHVVDLSYFKGLTQTEIAMKTGQPLGTVKTRMRLALKKLRTALSAEIGAQA
ncbi:MAG: sigma-70 family RNA polymerase sigma factor [Chloroflexi bacterium]|nr:sigma-70 family RNA polymerase sigma factor [Chloroflexota bacterium]MBT3862508.1 sigma-70 family RNA polymerase sigma factor [Chloroflexota bacterium]MBT5253212.1 sigma-70 family RNA polymerase sigma factor [Chloroflexota bacterium]MBT5475939.1 sigma-70 family RNA polymerase sigma factor [Chloroflexota bacterium]MBT7832994.1 sigma-70 family RNA polymerase sigma factor [Chloroflexota bacterium]